MGVITDKKRIDQILNRGVIVSILPTKEAFRKALLSGKKLRMYWGADPTSSALHLSHAKNYMLLEEFRQLGHEVVVLFGDFTARIGDPSDRTTARKQLSVDDVKANVKDWIRQIKPLMDFDAKINPPKVMYNSQWLAKLSLEDIIELAANFTVQQMIERDMFQERLKKQAPIHLHEFLYPLMQGYDSMAVDVDVELCGTDQTFNALAGRTLLKKVKNKEKFVVTVNLMENPKTKELMSKSRGTGVFLNSSAKEMYGSIMAQPDEMIELFLINNTRISLDEIKKLNIPQQPRAAKAKAAYAIVKIFYGESAAQEAEEAFEAQFSKKEQPTDIPVNQVDKSNWHVADLLLETDLASSKSEANRLFNQKGIRLNSVVVEDSEVMVHNGDILQVGKRKFVRLQVK